MTSSFRSERVPCTNEVAHACRGGNPLSLRMSNTLHYDHGEEHLPIPNGIVFMTGRE